MRKIPLILDPNPILRTKNLDVAFPLSPETLSLIDQMVFSCKKNRGIGLAAPQIGKNLNIAVINLQEFELPTFPIINPKITSRSFKKTYMEEGCLSIPRKFGLVKRPERITVKFFDINGKQVKVKLDGMVAKVFQHEIDHLNGIIISDKWKEGSVNEVPEERKL